ncbi:hypothetical protein [Ornithinimicrobium sp. LYQ103]|uniref:hypothetical protein n=1 Tax=Ornithinimicrobium sp. LYQ103 TaxID=3378796 RepID=UPI003852F9B3
MSVVSVAELRAAWHAAADGQFGPAAARAHPGTAPGAGVRAGQEAAVWSPPTLVLPVIGCHGSAGCTSVAVAVATALAGPVRVVETAPAVATGLSGFATAELGPTGTGWVRGRRDHLVLDRRQDGYGPPGPVPVPDAGQEGSSVPVVLDLGCGARSGWLATAVAAAGYLVLVTTATVPGMRRLEGVLHELDPDRHALVLAVRGPVLRRWPRPVTHTAGPRTRALLQEALVQVPHDPGLAVRGLDTEPLPGPLLGAAARIVTATGLPAGPSTHQEGNNHGR